MRLTVSLCLLAAVALLAGCTGSHDADHHAEGVDAAAQHLDRAVLDDPTRPEDEKAQDGDRKAIELYEWLGVQPGMAVADVFCGGGYNTHLLSRTVGDAGKVFSVFEFYADKEAFDGQVYKVDEVTERVAANELNNVELTTKLSDLNESSLDVMLIVRNYHDVEWVFEDLKRQEVVTEMFRAAKPGGIVGIVDLVTDNPGWDQEAHRLNQSVVIEDFTGAGFELIDTSDMLANPKDDHSAAAFDIGRHTMDRYLLKFKKPA